jgi:hypothetical protein
MTHSKVSASVSERTTLMERTSSLDMFKEMTERLCTIPEVALPETSLPVKTRRTANVQVLYMLNTHAY